MLTGCVLLLLAAGVWGLREQITPPRPGPDFFTVDAVMDDWDHTRTLAQREAYWETVRRTVVTWTGEVIDVSTVDGGLVGLNCNPRWPGVDVRVRLDGVAAETLTSLTKGEIITVRGILQAHTSAGYELSNGTLVPLAAPTGPSFMDVDLVMDDERHDKTSEERERFWAVVWRSEVTWTGVLLSNLGDRSLRLNCHPQKSGTDTVVELLAGGAGSGKLPEGALVTVRGIINRHDYSGYQLKNGRVLTYQVSSTR